MKKLLLPILGLVFMLCGATRLFSFPIYDPFNYTPGVPLWGQTDGNGDFWWEIDSSANPANAILVTPNSVTYPGLPASAGTSVVLSNLNGGQGGRMFVNTNNTLYFFGNGSAGAPYPGPIDVLVSMVINITNMANLATTPVYVMGYNDQGSISVQGGNPGTMVYRIYFKSLGAGGTNYQIGISKQGAGPYFATNILNTYQDNFIVMDETITNCGDGEPNGCDSDIATLWVNPPASFFGGNTEPANSAIEGANIEGNLTPYTSCFMFENRSTTTPNALLVGQFRMGTNWAWVTGGPCFVNNNPATSNIYNTNFSLAVQGLDNGSANTYQWLLNGTNITNGLSISGSGATVSGANTTTISINHSIGQDSGSYSLIVSNSVGSYTNLVSAVSVFQPEPPSITTEPGPSIVPLYAGGSDIISFATQGSPPITYYWYSNSVVVAVTTNAPSDTISNVAGNATVYCLASNAFGTTNTTSVSIQLQPAPTAPYPLVVLGDKPIDFWLLNETPDNGSGNVNTPAIDYVGGNDGYYTNVDIGLSGYGSGLESEYGYSPATDTETAAEFGYYPSLPSTNNVVGGIPNINFTAPQDSPAFSVEAWVNGEGNNPNPGTIVAKGSGTESTPGDQFSLEYVSGQWQFYVRDASGIAFYVASSATLDTNWHHIVGVMDTPIATLFLYVDGVCTATNGGYALTGVGSNTIGIENISQPVTIGSAGSSLLATFDKNWQGKINDVAIYESALSANQVSNHYYAAGIAPQFSVQPVAYTNISYGSPVTLPTVVVGTGPLSYEWIDNNTSLPISGQTNSALSIADVTNTDYYYVIVTSPYGTATSQYAEVSVVVAPEVIQDITPLNAEVVAGTTVSFVVGVDGAAPITYNWQYDTNTTLANGGRITGATSNILTLTNAQVSDSGSYQLFASNVDGGPVNSSQATLSVSPSLSFFDDTGTGWTSQQNPGSIWGFGGSILNLTSDLGNEDTAAFYSSPVYIGGFEASFTYDVLTGSNNSADGTTFCIQNDPRGGSALGADGGSLGVGTPNPITPSFEVEFNIYASDSLGGVGMAVQSNGVLGTVSSTAPVVINSGDLIDVTMTYVQPKLTIQLLDTVTSAQYTMVTNVNIPTLVGGNTAYVGFTGADGGAKSSQQVTDFSFISLPSLTIQRVSNQALLTWPTLTGAYTLEENSSLLTTNWVNVTNTVATINGTNQVSVTPNTNAQFFRLQLQ